MPAAAALAAQLRALADEVAALDDPAPDGHTPPPGPETPPGKPTGLACAIGSDGKPVLSWDPAADAKHWEVRDESDPDPATRVKDVVDQPRSVRSAVKAGARARRYVIVAVGPTGLRSEPSDPLDVPATGSAPTPDPGPDKPAASGVDLSRWYLTLPTGKPGSPDTIHQPQLATYQSKYFQPTADGITCRVWHGGVTTSGSPNPRTELRECNPDGSLAKWSAAKGTHTMTVVGQVNRLTKVRPHVVLWQIHGASDDVTVFRLEGTSLWITDGDNTHGHLVTDQLPLGQRYELKGQAENGQVRYWFNGQPVDYALPSSDAGCYFKAGCYAQTNPKSAPTESTSEYDEVVLHSVTVTHAT